MTHSSINEAYHGKQASHSVTQIAPATYSRPTFSPDGTRLIFGQKIGD